MAANIVDRLVGYFDPQAGARRLRARAAFDTFSAFSGLGADGAPLSPSNSRWVTTPRSANADTTRGLSRKRADSRELRATNPLAAGAIETNITRVVGTGLQPVAQPAVDVLGWTPAQAEAFKAVVHREWSMFADSRECTWDGQTNFYEWQALVLGGRLESGDCFTILPDADPTATQPYSLRLQLLEADRCDNPASQVNTDNLVSGVRIDNGRPTGYYILDRHPGSITATGTNINSGRWYEPFGPSGRRRILHHFRPTRPEQARGVPYLAPVVQAIKDLGRYTEAEITAAVMSAFFTVFIEQDGASNPAPIFGASGTPTAEGATPVAPADGDVELAPGAVIGLGKGEKANFANPNRPNTAYEPFVQGVCTLIAVGLHMPRELLLKTFNASYSASRAALLDAWNHFRSERAWLVASACQPVFETWMAEAVRIGRIQAPGFFRDPLLRWAYTRATWHGDSQGSLNPKDEVAAYTAAIDARLMTRERATWELFGTDWSRAYPTMRAEQQQLAADSMLPAPRAGAAAPAPSEGGRA